MQVYDSLRHYEFLTDERKWRIAKKLKVTPSRYSYLRSPEQYRPKLSDDEKRAIARLLNQPADYVARQYEVAA